MGGGDCYLSTDINLSQSSLNMSYLSTKSNTHVTFEVPQGTRGSKEYFKIFLFFFMDKEKKKKTLAFMHTMH